MRALDFEGLSVEASVRPTAPVDIQAVGHATVLNHPD